MKISRSKQFKKDMRKYSTKMTGKHFEDFIEALSLLIKGEKLPERFLDHELSGRLKLYREFHIGGDLVVMYRIENDVIYLLRLGTHVEVFGDF